MGQILRRFARPAMFAAVAALSVIARPASGAASATTGKVASPEPDKFIDPNVMVWFERMGAYLRGLPFVNVKADVIADEVTAAGQKIQYAGTVRLFAQRPDRLRVDITTDRIQRQLFYDGKTFTQYDADTGFYASVSAPPTIAEVIETVESRFGVQVPLAHLFFWGADEFAIGRIQSARYVGKGVASGVACDQFAFRQPDYDWQVCVTPSARPWPLILVVTATREPAQPQYTSVLDWDLSTKLVESAYHFVPPAGSNRTEFQQVK